MKSQTLKDKYALLRQVNIRCGNSFKGIKKFALCFQNGAVEIKSNASPEKKELYPYELQTQEQLSMLQEELLALQIEDWEKSYVGASALDYDEWLVAFAFTDGEKWEFQGINSFPRTWGKVQLLVKKYSGIYLQEEE